MTQSPFKFLDSYTKQDKDIFFGREHEVSDLYTRIFQGKVLLLYGASGTGKSSLVSCGLANRFQDADWLPVNVRRGVNINESFRQQLEKCMLTPLTSRNGASLQKVIKSVYLDHFKPIFVVLDQFEELFIFGDREEWMQFVTTVREILDSELQVRFIFIIRGEYLEHLTDFEPVLPEIFRNRMRIERMTRTNALNCVTGPCRSAGIEVEGNFAENLLNKLSPNKAEIELTYLQVFLDRIFTKAKDRAVGDKIVFSNAVITELGNIGDVLAQFLDEQIELIPESEKALALLKAFVSSDATKKQVSEVQARDFVNTIGHPLDEKEVSMLIQELVSRRILKDKDEAGRYELRHDSIAAKIFEKITSYERDLIEVNQFIAYAFVEHGKRGFVLNESDLAYIAPYEGKLVLSAEVRNFIARCRQLVRRRNRNRKRSFAITAVISFLLVTSVMGLIYSQRQKSAADQNAVIAQQQSEEALKQKQEAEIQRVLAEEKRLEAVRFSEVALSEKREADRQRAIAKALQSNAEQGQKEAIEQKSYAEAARLQAEQFAQLADKNLQIATTETQKAERYRMLAIAQAMGAKAVQLYDVEQKVLVSTQAFLFNKRYNGYAYQPEIYSGLYSAYEKVNGDKFNTFQTHKGAVKGLVHESSEVMITAGGDGKINRVDARVEPPTVTELATYPSVFHSVAISRSKKWLAIALETGGILIYSLPGMDEQVILNAHLGPVWSVEFDGEDRLVSAGQDQMIRQWDLHSLASSKERNTLSAIQTLDAGSAINSLTFDESTQTLAVGLSNGTVVLFDFSTSAGGLVKTLPGESPVTFVRYNPSATVLAIGKFDGSITILDAVTWEVIQSLNGHLSQVTDLEFNSDGSFMASASYDGTSMLWNMKSPSERQVIFTDHGGWVLQAGFSPDGRHVWTGDALGALRTFSLTMDNYVGLCEKVKRNMTSKEWNNFVGTDIPYEATCNK
jgi:WD40 repeat protein